MAEPTRFRPSSREDDIIQTNKEENYGYNKHPQFNVDKHADFVRRRGVDVLWERSFLCTCFNPKTRSPETLCPICKGRGIGYLIPVKTKMVLQNQKRSVMNQQYGMYDAGTSLGTTLPESPITFNDRITISDSVIEHSFVFDVTSYRIKNGMWLSYDTDEITFAVTENMEYLVADEDYIFDEEENRFYPKEHLLGKNISLNLKAKLRFIVTDILKESRMQYAEKKGAIEVDRLSKLLLLKREDNWVNSTPFSLDDGKEVPLEMPSEKDSTVSSGGFFGGQLDA